VRQVEHLQVLRPVEVLGGQTLVDGRALGRVAGEVPLRLLERGVAAVAGGQHVEARRAHEGQVARRREVVGVRVGGLDQGALGAAREALELVGAHAEVLEDQARRLLDGRKPGGDRASPEHRVVPHAGCSFTATKSSV